jgi:hypothetical protein
MTRETVKSTRRYAIAAIAGSTVIGGCVASDDAPVTSREGLLTAIAAASRGDTVTVDPDAEISLDGVWKVTVPAGVTLSGGRGDERPGAVLYSEAGDEGPNEKFHKKFRVQAEARFTGFRLRGHHQQYVNPETAFDGNHYAHRGGGIRAFDGAEVDNNEISGWPHAAVFSVGDAHIHHNYIHHNTWDGLGYGVGIPDGDHMPIIEYNYFNYNRHSITGGGGPEVGYVAQYNIFGADWVGAQVDMHGTEGMTGVAGKRMEIRHNTFKATHAVRAKTRNPDREYPAILIRGTPAEGVWVENNWFRHADRDGAYEQPGGPANVTFDNNHYGEDPPLKSDIGAPTAVEKNVL